MWEYPSHTLSACTYIRLHAALWWGGIIWYCTEKPLQELQWAMRRLYTMVRCSRSGNHIQGKEAGSIEDKQRSDSRLTRNCGQIVFSRTLDFLTTWEYVAGRCEGKIKPGRLSQLSHMLMLWGKTKEKFAWEIEFAHVESTRCCQTRANTRPLSHNSYFLAIRN